MQDGDIRGDKLGEGIYGNSYPIFATFLEN